MFYSIDCFNLTWYLKLQNLECDYISSFNTRLPNIFISVYFDILLSTHFKTLNVDSVNWLNNSSQYDRDCCLHGVPCFTYVDELCSKTIYHLMLNAGLKHSLCRCLHWRNGAVDLCKKYWLIICCFTSYRRYYSYVMAAQETKLHVILIMTFIRYDTVLELEVNDSTFLKVYFLKCCKLSWMRAMYPGLVFSDWWRCPYSFCIILMSVMS